MIWVPQIDLRYVTRYWVARFAFALAMCAGTAAHATDPTDCTSHPTVTVSTTAALVSQLQAAQGCEVIRLAPGNYADLSISGYPTNVFFNYDNFVTIESANPAAPAVFQAILVSHASYIRFRNIVVHHEKRAGEQDWARAFDVASAHHIEVLDSTIHGSVDGNYDNDVYGFFTSEVNDLLFEGNTLHDLTRGSIISSGDRIIVRNNFYHGLRSDGADFGGVVDVLVEGNRFTDFHPCCGDHPDMIQFWNDGGTRHMRDVVISNNVLLRGPSEWTQSIFIQSNAPAYRNQNFLIEGNVIYNAHIHGISIADTDGVTIRHNTVLTHHVAPGELTPSINTYSTTAAVVRDNVATAYSDSGTNTVYLNNVTAQNGTTTAQRALPTHYDNLFLNANSGAQAVRDDFLPRPGSILIANPGLDIGALEYDATPDQLTALILASVSTGAAPLAVHFDGMLSGGPHAIQSYSWNFADGQVGSGAVIEHVFQTLGTYPVSLSVTDSTQSIDVVQKTIIVNPPPIVGLVYGLTLNDNLLDFSGNEISTEWVGTPSYGPGFVGQAMSLDGTPSGPFAFAPHREELDGMGNLTLSFWARKNSSETGGTVILKHITYQAQLSADRFFGYLFNQQGDRFDFSVTSPNIEDTSWHHYAVSYNGTSVIPYVDGQPYASTAMTGAVAINTDRDLDIGKDPWGDSFNGSIDEIRIFNIALTPSQIDALATPNGAPLVDAGPDLSVVLPNAASLSGSFIDDGLPLFGTLVPSWSKVSGPGIVEFSDSSDELAQATFSEPGDYVLRYAVHDGEDSGSDDVAIHVIAAEEDPPSDYHSRTWRGKLTKRRQSKKTTIQVAQSGELTTTLRTIRSKLRVSLQVLSSSGRKVGSLRVRAGRVGSLSNLAVEPGKYTLVVRGAPTNATKFEAQITFP